MQTNRKVAHAPRSRSLASDIADIPVACVGCEGCEGICAALIEAMTLPDVILRDRTA